MTTPAPGPIALVAALTVAACAPTEARFPLLAPLWQDGDLGSVAVGCRHEPAKNDPGHVACAPRSYDSPLIWDGMDNLLFRPLSETLGVVASRESVNVNSLDEVPDSSFFTNRLGIRDMTVEELVQGGCDPSQLVEDKEYDDDSWIIDKGKLGGSTDGFRVVVPGKGKYLLKVDDADAPDRSSAAQTVGAAVYHAAGFYTSCERIVYVKRSWLKLLPGLRQKRNFTGETDFDRKAVDVILSHAPKRGPFLRFQASAWLPGYILGAFRYEGTRPDDPNDVVAHEDRRELRGARLIAAWLDRFDTREGNTLDSWSADDKRRPDGSPGHIIHYQMDTSECFGSEWDWEPISRRLGYSYVFDGGDIAREFITFGAETRPWDRVRRTPGRELFGYYNVDDFVPDEWKNEYSNAAYSRMTERDAAWMARILARFTPEKVHALARLADLSDPGDAAYLESVLEGRLRRILDRYLTRLSPLTDVRVDHRTLCAADLAMQRGLRPAGSFHYTALSPRAPGLLVQDDRAGHLCVTIPPVAENGGPADDAPERYIGVTIADGVARGPLVAWLYDLGPTRGLLLAGIQRPER